MNRANGRKFNPILQRGDCHDLKRVILCLSYCPNVRKRSFLYWVGWLGFLDWLFEAEKYQRNVVRDKRGFNPLHLAVWNMHELLIKMYIGSFLTGANDATERGWVALHLAAWNNDVKTMNMLADVGASIDIADKQDWTALHWAASGGSEGAINWLVQKGLDANARTEDGETALHIAAKTGRFNVIKTLIRAGVDTSARDNAMETAFDVALLAPCKWRDATREAFHNV